jgi:hypothetical protein
MRESLIFPYLQGSEWVRQLYRKGGWTMVSNAFTRLPLSTEQVLHPEKYFNYERPIKIVLPDLTNLLNASKQQTANGKQQTAGNIQRPVVGGQRSAGTAGVPPASTRLRVSRDKVSSRPPLPITNRPLPTAAWHRIESDVNGEWTYYLILDQFLGAPVESKHAAAGWAGDRYALYEGPNGQVFLAQLAAWDTEIDAREFFDAYVKRTELRYPGAKRLEPANSVTPNSEREMSWQTSEGLVTIELRGLRVVILEGVPEGVDSSSLMRAFGQ